MGDRAYARIEVSAKDQDARKLLEDEYGYTEDLDENGILILSDEESNYGASNEQEYLRKAKIPFTGYHEEGDNYPSCIFAFDGEIFSEVLHNDEEPVARINPDGSVNSDDIKACIVFHAVYARAQQRMIAFDYLKATTTT